MHEGYVFGGSSRLFCEIAVFFLLLFFLFFFCSNRIWISVILSLSVLVLWEHVDPDQKKEFEPRFR